MGNRLREHREKSGLTVEQAALKAGLSPGYLSRMETGERNVTLKNLSKISKALGVPPRDLVDSEAEAVPLVGYAAAGTDTVTFADGDGGLGEVDAPTSATEKTVAVQVRGTSLGVLFDGWIAFYDERRDPPDESMAGRVCVCGLDDGRVVIKRLAQGSKAGLWHLQSATEPALFDQRVIWAARVTEMRPG